jgi:3-hydroxyacyl-[acyl-carrier-protein] dehydratase
MDIKEIIDLLPHRYPFLLVDRIIEFEEGHHIIGIKNVTINEPFFVGHFPERPIMPGVLIIEAMAQVGGLFILSLSENKNKKKLIYFTGMNNVRFRKPVVPGDQIKFVLEPIKLRKFVSILKGKAYVDSEIIAEAELMFSISK